MAYLAGRPAFFDQAVWEYEISEDRFHATKAWWVMRGIGDVKGQTDRESYCIHSIHPNDIKKVNDVINGHSFGDKEYQTVQFRMMHNDGHWMWILCQCHVVERDANNFPSLIFGIDIDFSEHGQDKLELVQLNNKLQLANESAGIGIWEFDPATGRVEWDDQMLSIYGITDGNNDRSGTSWEEHLHPDDLEKMTRYSEECDRLGLDFRHDYRIIRGDGAVRWIRSMARKVQDTGALGKLIGINIDVTDDYERSQQLEDARKKLEFDSRHDALTGLANRRLLDETVDNFIPSLMDTDRFAVFHMDLDNFKNINDTYGHAAGDAILVNTAKNLKRILNSGLVCRVGGDEFVALLEKAPTDKVLANLAETLVEASRKPFFFEGIDCTVGISIGIDVCHGKPATRSQTFANADMALYAAKASGRDRYQFFSERMKSDAMIRMQEKQEIADAIANRQIVCHFQPQYDAQSLRLIGAEVLARWNCPIKGLRPAAEFIPKAKKYGLSPRIDETILRQVLEQQTEWKKQGIVYPTVSLNLSKERLAERSLKKELQGFLEPHHKISFELLETSFLDKIAGESLRNLNAIREMGIGIELDDFGSGHSSVVALQTIKPDRVKIDQMLVLPIVERPAQTIIIDALSKIANMENTEVILEGIETKEHLRLVRNIPCNVLQGYALSHPIAAEDFTKLLADLDQGVSEFTRASAS